MQDCTHQAAGEGGGGLPDVGAAHPHQVARVNIVRACICAPQFPGQYLVLQLPTPQICRKLQQLSCLVMKSGQSTIQF